LLSFLCSFYQLISFTFNDAMSDTLRWVCTVSNCSKHHSSSSIVSIAKRIYESSPGAYVRFAAAATAAADACDDVDGCDLRGLRNNV
jgi:hypothetical protein